MADIIKLNVGGVLYTTTKATLTMYPDSMLGAMFSGSMPNTQDDQGNYFIDRDGSLFIHVLNFLRSTKLALPEDFKQHEQLALEADFYQIEPLISALKEAKTKAEISARGTLLTIHYYTSKYSPVILITKRGILKMLAEKYKPEDLEDFIEGDEGEFDQLILKDRHIVDMNVPYEIDDYLNEMGGQFLTAHAFEGTEDAFRQTWRMPFTFNKSIKEPEVSQENED